MLSSITGLVFAMAHTCSLASRSPVLRPATLAAHTPGMASGTHACTQQMQHLDSNQYHDATSGARPESGLPLGHGGRSTRGLLGRTPFVLLPSSCGSTSGRRLTSCCMTAGELEPYNGVILPQLARRPPRARFLLSRSDARAHSSSPCRPVVSRRQWSHHLLLISFGLISFCLFL